MNFRQRHFNTLPLPEQCTQQARSGASAFGLYWKRANIVGAYCSLLFRSRGTNRLPGLEQLKGILPSSMLFLIDVNVAGFMSFVLAALGMILGSLATQRSHPPIVLKPKEEGA